MRGTVQEGPSWPILFSPVMATGVVSLAAGESGLGTVADVLLWVTAVLYLVLLGYHGVRIARRPGAALRQLRTSVIFDYLTFVAAGSVLGSALLASGAARWTGWVLLILSGIVWVALSAAVAFELFGLRSLHPRTELRGGWLLAVVAPQSLSVLALDLAQGTSTNTLAVLALVLWVLGGVLYVPIAIARVRRLGLGQAIARALRADDWILMGSLAISALAGSRLADQLAHNAAPGAGARPYVLAVTVAQFIIACALVVLLGWGELVHARAPSHSTIRPTERWTTVFPLGMLSVAAHALAGPVHLTWLPTLGDVLLVPALATWLATAIATWAGRVRVRRC